MRNVSVPNQVSSGMDKELLISSLAPLPVWATLVKSSVHEAHFHFLASCSPGLICCFMWPVLEPKLTFRPLLITCLLHKSHKFC